MTCTTKIHAHECLGTSQPNNLCNECAKCKTLILKKHARRVASINRELKANTPLCHASKKCVSAALKIARKQNSALQKQVQQINNKLKEELVSVSNDTHEGLTLIMEKCKKNSFIELFWKEQKKAFQRKNCGMRWHPMMLRFAILVHSQSPSTYRSLKNIGVLRLPSESTLRDYTNVVHPTSGFRIEVFAELKNLAADLNDNERWVVLLHDEISIKADLVYDKITGDLVGFVNSNTWDNKSKKDGHLATHALVFMVVGITSNIKMSIGYFPTRTATADQLFPAIWQAIGLIECFCNLKVSMP